MSRSDEWFDVCDHADRVIGRELRDVVHARNLLHRAVHIWVWDTSGRLLLQTRSATKDQYPNCFTSSASGHLDAGEDYEQAAHRELQEELGLTGVLKFRVKLPQAGPETAYEHTVLYELITDEPPQPDAGEIAAIRFWTVDEVDERIRQHPEDFTPPFRMLWMAVSPNQGN